LGGGTGTKLGLLGFAMRIKARAVDRAGQIIRSFPATPGKRTDLEPGEGARPGLGRLEAAHEAGLSRAIATTRCIAQQTRRVQ
jgi:hypothetical protein